MYSRRQLHALAALASSLTRGEKHTSRLAREIVECIGACLACHRNAYAAEFLNDRLGMLHDMLRQCLLDAALAA